MLRLRQPAGVCVLVAVWERLRSRRLAGVCLCSREHPRWGGLGRLHRGPVFLPGRHTCFPACLQGYLPRDLYDLNSKFGSEADLRECIASMHEHVSVLEALPVTMSAGSPWQPSGTPGDSASMQTSS